LYPSIEELLNEIPDSRKHVLKHMAFAIIRPDALERGIEKNILDDLAGHGLQVVAFKYQFVDERQMEEVYRYTQHRMLENQMRPLWWMTREMYKISPALLVLLAGGFSNEFEDAALYLESLKGSSNPVLTKSGHLRYKYRSMNVILCTIHSSDDCMQSLRESRIFFHANEFLTAMDHAEIALKGDKTEPHAFLERAVEQWYGRSKRQGAFFEILTTLKIRVLANLIHWGKHGFPVQPLRELYEEMLIITKESLPYVQEAELMHPLLDKEKALLDSYFVQYDTFVPQSLNIVDNDLRLLFHALSAMANYEGFSKVNFLDFREWLRRNLVVMDGWEALVLETSFVFHMIQLQGYYVK
jgi:nucleoside diphosphate kinase